MWYLDQSIETAHNKPQMPEHRATELTDAQITAEKYKFVVVRHPVNRFMSLYFDKIIGPQEAGVGNPGASFHRNADIEIDAGTDIERHRINIENALNFIASQRKSEPLSKINWHWKPQMVRMGHLRDYEFHTLHLEGLNFQLPQILGDIVPDVDKALQAIASANKSSKPVQSSEILTGELRMKIRQLYRIDYRLWKEVRNYWRDRE